jgi:REP element-mobilizing transposase RayT
MVSWNHMAYRRTSHAVYELNYHFVWPPKYRKHIGTKEVKKFLEDLFPQGGLQEISKDTG